MNSQRANDHIFTRYRAIVDHWDAFQAALRQPLPTCIWTNTLRITPHRLAALMADDGIVLEPLSWHPAAFRLPDDVRPGWRWEFLTGLFHIQEEVALLPVLLLDPQPGERVLDARRDCRVSAQQAQRCTGMGYVLVRYQHVTLGVGLYLPDAGKGADRLCSMYPKAWSPAID